MSTSIAATKLGVPQRRILKRIASGDLRGEKQGGRWMVELPEGYR